MIANLINKSSVFVFTEKHNEVIIKKIVFIEVNNARKSIFFAHFTLYVFNFIRECTFLWCFACHGRRPAIIITFSIMRHEITERV